MWKDIRERKVSDTYGMSDTGGLRGSFAAESKKHGFYFFKRKLLEIF